jgi:hypothetical protein
MRFAAGKAHALAAADRKVIDPKMTGGRLEHVLVHAATEYLRYLPAEEAELIGLSRIVHREILLPGDPPVHAPFKQRWWPVRRPGLSGTEQPANPGLTSGLPGVMAGLFPQYALRFLRAGIGSLESSVSKALYKNIHICILDTGLT